MKKINKFLSAATLLALVLGFSCSEDDTEGLTPQPKPMASATQTSFTITEGETAYIPFTIDNPTNNVSQFKIEVVGGSASQNTDYTAGDGTTRPEVGIVGDGFDYTAPAFASSFEIPFYSILDIWPEDTETATLRISAAGNRTVLTQASGVMVNITINNATTDDFVWGLEWTGGDDHLCDLDFDLELYDASFASTVATSYFDCPESITVHPGDLSDGDYWLVPEFYSSNGYEAGVVPPVMMTFAKPGVWVETIDLTGLWDTTNGGLVEGFSDWYLIKYQLNIAGTTYTITDTDTGEVVVSGRLSGNTQTQTIANFKSRRPL